MSRAPAKPPTDASVTQGKNEYIPKYISRKPFYIDDSTFSDADYLEHQRLQSLPQDTLSKSKWYDRGRRLGPAATKFRKGACENCGAMTHKTKECLSRPRKEGARWTGRDIQADEMVGDVKLGWDAKRDRWNGYDAREYSAVIEEYEELEALKKAATTSKSSRTKESKEGRGKDGDEVAADDDEVEVETESAKYGEETDMGRNQPTSTRNLRIREDTAKYLMNLDLESSRYDPKTRSMATDVASKTASGAADAAGENFVRPSSTKGDAVEFEKAQRYAWETQEHGTADSQRLHLQANPTEGEILLKKKTAESAAKKEAHHKALLDKYGGAEHLQPATNTRAAENDRYVEYDEDGNIKSTSSTSMNQLSIPSSKYAEDVLINNHTSIWGSWWHRHDSRWGYQCCHSTVKNSYCTGEEGKQAFADVDKLSRGDTLPFLPGDDGGGDQVKTVVDGQIDQEQTERGEDANHASDTKHQDRNNKNNNNDDDDDDENSHITTKANNHTKAKPSSTPPPPSKKRPFYNHNHDQDDRTVTEAEMEQYKRSKLAADDPMAAFLGREDGMKR